MKKTSQQLSSATGGLDTSRLGLFPALRRNVVHLFAAGVLATFSPVVLAGEPSVGLEQSPINITSDAVVKGGKTRSAEAENQIFLQGDPQRRQYRLPRRGGHGPRGSPGGGRSTPV